jgi:hypothetical protein
MVCVWLLSAYYRPIKNGKPQKRETLFVLYQIDGEEKLTWKQVDVSNPQKIYHTSVV